MKIVATTSLPAVDRPNADRWNAARSRQYNRLIVRFNFLGSDFAASMVEEEQHSHPVTTPSP